MQRLLQTVLLACALLLSFWARLPMAAMLGLGFVAGAMLLSTWTRASWIDGVDITLLWIGTFTAWIGVALGGIGWDFYYTTLAGATSGAIWLTPPRAAPRIRKARWHALVMAWLLCGAFMWLGAGYFQNQRGLFFGGLLATLLVLAFCRVLLKWGAFGGQIINTLLLLLVALPLVDLAIRPQSRTAIRPGTYRLYYSYDAAKGDPASFARWAEYYTAQFDHLWQEIFTTPLPNSGLPFRLRPESHGLMMSSPISINSLGFRGPEITAAKNGLYRIVAIGESSTFGMTIDAGDEPWPARLEQIIHDRLKTRRPVQVINAGVPAYSVETNLRRLRGELLALRPDMVISYHGANGFAMIDSSVLPAVGPAPPVYEERPIKLLADAEHRLRLLLFQRRYTRRETPAKSTITHPLDTRYAAVYRELIECCRSNQVRLALANFSMAVNQASDPKVVDFYRGGGSRVAIGFMRANAVHSQIVSELAAQHPEVNFVDTHPHLDGDHEKFIDLIHLDADGERQMAENMFNGIRATLEKDLAPQ